MRLTSGKGKNTGKNCSSFLTNIQGLKDFQLPIRLLAGDRNIEVPEQCLGCVVFLRCFKDVETSYLVGASGRWKFSLSISAWLFFPNFATSKSEGNRVVGREGRKIVATKERHSIGR